jgi:dipeptidyl aminopeptidase/acylaminoacyl peptidase
MKRILHFLIIILTMNTAIAQQAPLLDRELFFGNPEISGGQISPDGEWISFLKEYDGIMNIWVKKFDAPFETAKPLTDSKRPLYGYFWTNDSKYILYVKDKNGDENINIFAVNPLASPEQEGSVPTSRNLTPLKDVTAQIQKVSKKDPDVLFISLNDRDKAWHDLYQLNISTGKLTKIYENKDRITSYDFDWNEQLRVLSKTDEKGNTIMYRIEKRNVLTPIYDFNVNESAYIAGWSEKNDFCYLISNKGAVDLMTLYKLDPNTKKIESIESDPEKKVDIDGVIFNSETFKLIGTSYTLNQTKYYWKDSTWESMYNYLTKRFPNRTISFQSHTKDYTEYLIAVTGDKYAAEVYYFDAVSKAVVHQYTPRPKLKAVEQHLAAMTPISYKSSDGLEIPAYLTLPVGASEKNLPVVVLVHGGPKGPRDYWGYNPLAQLLANRGYAVLQPNFRASGGFGKKFLNAGDLQWGKLMQDDITWGVKHLIQKGIANKSKIAIMGGSYGGYATLAGLAFTPAVYACGVDIVGPSNIFTLLESVPAYWESGRAFLYGMVGDPNTEEGKKRIKEASPLFSADKIKKPLLIIQGANDPRVKQAEADQIVIALRDKGQPVEYLLADDEGHGFSKPINSMAMYAEVEQFLEKHLGGRAQKFMPEDVSKRLKELKVDINTVKYEAPKIVATDKSWNNIHNTIVTGTTNYTVELALGGQKIPMSMTRIISKTNNQYTINEAYSGAMGNIIDEVILDEKLQPIQRKMDQMGQSIQLAIDPNKIVYTQNDKTENVPLNGIFIVDGPGTDIILGNMDLKKDVQLIYETLDFTSMKLKQNELIYLGEEMVNQVKCIKVKTVNLQNPNDYSTYWINPKTHVAEKMQTIITAANNAVMTIQKK